MGNDAPVSTASARPAGLTLKRKLILASQVIIVLLIVFFTVRALRGPGESTNAIPSTPNLSNVASAPSSGVAAPSKPVTGSSQTLSDIPQNLGGLKLVNALTGQEAIEDMSMLHGKGVGVVGGWVGHYQQKAIVWVGEIADEQGAVLLLQTMASRIGASNGPFRGLRQVVVNGQTLFFVTGQGQNHYFYQKGNKVIWLAMPVSGEDAFLRDALALIN